MVLLPRLRHCSAKGHHPCQTLGLDAAQRGFGSASFAETLRLLERGVLTLLPVLINTPHSRSQAIKLIVTPARLENISPPDLDHRSLYEPRPLSSDQRMF